MAKKQQQKSTRSVSFYLSIAVVAIVGVVSIAMYQDKTSNQLQTDAAGTQYNLIKNGSFEHWKEQKVFRCPSYPEGPIQKLMLIPDFWRGTYCYDRTQVSVTRSAMSSDGKYSVQYRGIQPGEDTLSQSLGTLEKGRYVLEFAYRADGNFSYSIEGKTQITKGVVKRSSEWKRETHLFEITDADLVPPKSKYTLLHPPEVFFSLRFSLPMESVWLDDVVVRKEITAQ